MQKKIATYCAMTVVSIFFITLRTWAGYEKAGSHHPEGSNPSILTGIDRNEGLSQVTDLNESSDLQLAQIEQTLSLVLRYIHYLPQVYPSFSEGDLNQFEKKARTWFQELTSDLDLNTCLARLRAISHLQDTRRKMFDLDQLMSETKIAIHEKQNSYRIQIENALRTVFIQLKEKSELFPSIFLVEATQLEKLAQVWFKQLTLESNLKSPLEALMKACNLPDPILQFSLVKSIVDPHQTFTSTLQPAQSGQVAELEDFLLTHPPGGDTDLQTSAPQPTAAPADLSFILNSGIVDPNSLVSSFQFNPNFLVQFHSSIEQEPEEKSQLTEEELKILERTSKKTARRLKQLKVHDTPFKKVLAVFERMKLMDREQFSEITKNLKQMRRFKRGRLRHFVNQIDIVYPDTYDIRAKKMSTFIARFQTSVKLAHHSIE